MDVAETEAIIAAAAAAKVTLVEAYMYRCHPQTEKAVELIKNGVLGKIRLVQATFGFHAPFNAQGRLFDRSLGGGAILDVGGYPASFACMVADAANQGEETAVACVGVLGHIDPQCDSDTIAIANLRFDNGISAQISVSTQLAQNNAARVYGDKGYLEIPVPWIVAPKGGTWSIDLHLNGAAEPERLSGVEERGLYGVEADCFAEIVSGQNPRAPYMSISDTLRVNSILESWQLQLRD